MGILRLVSFFIIMLVFTACETIYEKEYRVYDNISLKYGNSQLPKKVDIEMYRINNGFKNLERKEGFKTIIQDTISGILEVYFENFDSIPLQKNYKITIDDKIFYITEIKTYTKLRGGGTLRKDSIFNCIESLKINGELYKYSTLYIPYDNFK